MLVGLEPWAGLKVLSVKAVAARRLSHPGWGASLSAGSETEEIGFWLLIQSDASRDFDKTGLCYVVLKDRCDMQFDRRW